MERLLINAAKRSGIQLYDGTTEVGGGGKASTDDTRYATIYLLLSTSNDINNNSNHKDVALDLITHTRTLTNNL